MLYKNFNNLAISSLGMGCMRLPKKEDGTIDYEKTEEIIEYAYSHGINYYDTAFPYHDGESELVIGKILKKYDRDSFYLATKMPIWEVKEASDVEKIFNKQLEKCGVEYFDFYLCHAMNKNRHQTYIELKAYEFLERMKKEGKIRFLGFSFHDDYKGLEEIVNYKSWDFAQIQFNYLDAKLQNASKLYDLLKEKNIPSIIMEPVRGGFLANLSEEHASKLKALRPNSSISSWAIRYSIHHENNFVTLSGMSSMEQIIDNINTCTNFEYLTDEELKVLDNLSTDIIGENYIPCTACNYCVKCPKQIKIPVVFQRYNEYQIHKNKEYFIERIKDFNISDCVKCNYCVSQCPQHINIPDELSKILSIKESN